MDAGALLELAKLLIPSLLTAGVIVAEVRGLKREVAELKADMKGLVKLEPRVAATERELGRTRDDVVELRSDLFTATAAARRTR